MRIGKNAAAVLKCNFCGNPLVDNQRCPGCGGSSFTRVQQAEPTESSNDKAIQQVIKSQYKLKFFTLILATAIASIAFSIYNRSTLSENAGLANIPTNENSTVEYSQAEIRQLLSDRIPEEYEFLYAKIYSTPKNPGAENHTMLQVRNNSKPIVLVLNSYEAVSWRISNPSNVDIRAIVFSSTKPGTTITGAINSTTLQLPFDGVGVFNKHLRCSVGSTMDTSGKYIEIIMGLEKLGPGVLRGITLQNSQKTLQVPEMIMGHSFVQELKRKHSRCISELYSEISHD